VNVNRLLGRAAAVVLPTALVLGAAGTAFAAKPPRTPVPSVTSTPAKNSNSKSATFAWTTAASTTYTCSLDGSAYTTCSTPKTYTNLADRSHTFALKAALPKPAKPSTYSYQWTVDTLAPLAPVVSPITSPTSNTNAAVSFSDSDASVAGFTCALDGATPVACMSPHTYSSLAEGSHTVVVAAHDAAGNEATGHVTWVVDHTAPNIPVVVGPTSPTNNPDASVSFSGEVGATFTCSLDGATPTGCTSPWTATGLAAGSHTLTVTPYDAALNAGTPGTATWVVDLTPPADPVLVSAPANPTNDGAFTVRFAPGDTTTAGFLCTFQGGTPTPCANPWTVDPALVLTNTTYHLSVVALDQAGNTSGALPVSWQYDTAAPSPAEFVSGPSTPTNVANPTFDFIDTDTSTDHFTCALDGGTVLDPCAPGVALAAVPGGASVTDGSHALAVSAVDAASNASAPVLWHWNLDRSAPVSQPQTAPGVPLSSGPVTSTPTFVFSTDDSTVAGFVCKLDGATTWTPCESGYTPSVGDGSHTLQVATVDAAGNVGTPITYTWTLDTHAPTAALVAPTTLAGAPRVTFNEAVKGVTTSSVRLLLAGTSTVVPTTLSCVKGSTAVSCSSASGVTAAVLSHSARLVAGQRYSVAVTNAVHDLAGNAAAAVALPFRAQRVLQENELAVSQTWVTHAASAAYGGRYVQSHLMGATAMYSFRGTSITWYSATGPAMGTVNVYCGSTYKGRFNNYASTTHWRVGRTVKCSSTTANNVLRVVATGLKGSTKGKGTNVVVDAVKVGTTLTSNPVLTLRWAIASSSLATGGRYARADQSSEAFALTFRGTSITWRTLVGKNMGKAKVYIDGVYKGTYDQFATTTKVLTRTWKLTDKVHTIRVVATGTRRTGATSTQVVLDSLTVG
jgi:hypothetical protein